jgi:hypothetical protein
VASALLFISTLTVDGGTLTVDGSTQMVDDGTLMVVDNTLMVDGDTQTSDGQHGLGSAVTGTTRSRHHQAKQHPHVC